MLKVLTSSCLQAGFHNVRWTLNTNAHHTKEVNTPLHRHLGSLRGFNRKSSYIYRRIFCSDSSDGSEYVAGVESGTEGKRIEVEGQESDSKSSAAMVPSVFRPEDYFTVLFVCTPNVVEMIPSPLLDRMEVISVAGYVTDAKMRTLYRQVSKPNDFLYNQFRLFSSSIPNCSTTYPFDKSQVSNLIARQQWCELRLIVNQTDPSHFLLQLFDSGTDSGTLVAYFKWSQREFQVSYALHYYCKLFHLLAKDKKYPKIRALLHQFVKQGNNLNSSFFHALSISSDDFWVKSIIVDMLILTYAQNLKTDLAVEAFQRAGDYGYKLSALSCSPMLVALVKEGKFVLVEVVYKEMIRRRIELNFIIFNTVINGLCKAGKLQKAGDVLEEMKIWGFSPSVVTYNTLISGHCKKGRVGNMYKANEILKEMVDKNITANEITYNILIGGFGKNENISGAMKVFREMQRRGLKPGVITYNSLINALCHNGKLDEALVLRDEMVDLGLMPTVVTYNVLINGFSKKKMLEQVRDLFDDIPRQGLVPSLVTFNTVIDAYCKEGKLEEAIALYNLMFDRKIFPNVSTYTCLVGGFLREGNIEEAGKFLGKMEENGLKADVVTYNIRMDALCKKGEAREAAKLLDEMLEIGLSPSHITYNTLVAGYCGEGNLRAALNVRRRMQKERKRPNIITYNVLIKGFCEKGKLKEANAFINELLEKGLCPNRTTYDIIREEMMEKGFVPDIDGHLCYESVDS